MCAAVNTQAHADASERIEAVLRDAYLKNIDVGVHVVHLTPGDAKIIYAKNADRPLIPASNLKLVTTAAALEGLGGDFQFRTRLLRRDDTFALVGDGDPSLGDAELARLNGHNIPSKHAFDAWADALRKKSSAPALKLVYDDSIFDEQFTHPTWPADQIHLRYVAGVGGLNFNTNCVDFYLKPTATSNAYEVDPQTHYVRIKNSYTLGSKNAVWLSRAAGSNEIELRGQTSAANGEPISVTVDNPPAYAATVLAESLEKSGQLPAGASRSVARDVTVRAQIEQWKLLAVHETPISDVLTRANRDSMNLYAEALCKRLGAATSNASGSWKNGTVAVGAYLNSIGVDSAQFTLDDGCGLSRNNRISPAAITAVLAHEFNGPNREAYLKSLAVGGGASGTLKDRFTTAPLRGRVFGKSGFINSVSTLSGYVQSKDDQWYAFSIMFNGIAKGTNSNAKKLQERIVLAISDR